MWKPKVGDAVKGSWGYATICSVYPNTRPVVVQLSYSDFSTTETVVGNCRTVYALERVVQSMINVHGSPHAIKELVSWGMPDSDAIQFVRKQ